jgi:polyhydroxyalkanoate synthase subunit PhaC
MNELAALQARWIRALGHLATLPEPQLGATERTAVWSDGDRVLYRYRPRPRSRGTPLLIVYSLVNRPSVLDLDAQRSLIGAIASTDRDVYLLDWGRVSSAHPVAGLESLLATIASAGRVMAPRRRFDLMGVCQGGTLALVYAARYPARVRRLVTLVTPVDFTTAGDLVGRLATSVDVDALVRTFGAVPGPLLKQAFRALAPWRLSLGKMLDVIDHADDREWLARFARIERWIDESPDHPGPAFAEFVRCFYRENALVRGGLVIEGAPIDLGAIRHPVLNLYAKEDHLVPPLAARALGGLVGTTEYEEAGFDTGHIGVFVGAAMPAVAERIEEFLARPESRPTASVSSPTSQRSRSHAHVDANRPRRTRRKTR